MKKLELTYWVKVTNAAKLKEDVHNKSCVQSFVLKHLKYLSHFSHLFEAKMKEQKSKNTIYAPK